MSDDFKVLNDAQHLRLRPAMYIGSVESEPVSGMFFGKYSSLHVVPGLLKIISEIIDNSVDEAIRTGFKFANKIQVSILQESNLEFGDYWKVVVEDNGRGIPIKKIGDQWRPVIAWTQARAGSNFTNDRETIGANGVGSFATCVFSSEFIGETADGTNRLKMVSNGLAAVKSILVDASTKNYTRVSFIPDLSAFSITDRSATNIQSHIDFIHDRIENLAAVYPEIQFHFNGDKIKIKNTKEYAAKYCSKFVIAEDSGNTLIFGASGDLEEFRLHSYVNGLWIKNGGTHVNYSVDQITAALKEHIRKKHKIEVLPNQIKQHLTFVSIIRGFVNMKFDSQTKEKITNTTAEVAAHLKGIDFDRIAKQILNTPEIIDPIVSAILYKKEMQEKAALAKKQKSNSRLTVVNHIAATHPDVSKRTLFIVEGLSALGNLIAVRDPKISGGLPLKGKIMNVRGMKPVDILKSKEISELMAVIGLEYGKPADNLNYGKIAIMTDSDTDGAHIFCLLMNLFSYWPELFQTGKIYRATAPLYYLTSGKTVKSFYSKEEFDQFDNTGYVIEYFKGLGSMSKEIYKECINNPRLIQITDNTATDWQSLEMAFGSSADARKEWMMK